MSRVELPPIVDIGNDPENIQTRPIEECGEPVVEVTPEPRLFVSPQYHAQGIQSATNQIFVRAGVLDALRVASRELPEGVNLLLWDGLRTLETQAELFEAAKLSFGANEALVEQYLAAPPESEAAFHHLPPPHTTGGAVDLTLCDSSGKPFDMGAEFDEFEEIAWLAYFEQDRSERYGDRASVYKTHRRMLYWAMRAAGFAPYPWEFWHYELGTIVAANFHHAPIAKYGAFIPWRSPS